MSDRELLDEIYEILRDRDLRVTAMRNRILDLLVDHGYPDDED